MKVDIEALRQRNDARKRGDRTNPPCELDVDALIQVLTSAQHEIDSLSEQNADLKASAALWSNLYEKNVRRANEAEAKSAVAERPAAERYLIALDVVEVLKEALTAVVEDCPHCIVHAPASRTEAAERCERCARAVTALDAIRRSL